MKYSIMILVVVCIAALAVLFWHAKRTGEKAAAPGSMPAQQANLESKVAKIVIVNNDGYSSFYSGDFRTKEDLQKFVHQFKGTDVTIVEWCLGTGGTFNFDTKVGSVMGRGVDESVWKTLCRGDKLIGETVQRLIAEGNEPLRVVADQGRADGISVFVSLRPDAFYDASYADFSNGDFWRQNPDKRIVGRVLPGASIGVGLSYVYPEVRQFFLDIILEAVQRDVAGVNLDFERRPPYFGFEKPLVEGFYAKYGFNPPGENPELWWRYQAQFMTDFVRKVRDELDKAEKSLG
ncbi:MAG: hypothetical protein NT011_01180, partial [Kiritimatiellaeota bacterium]|nr:hypothetical protein [Kiritimatiellota bacterium]